MSTKLLGILALVAAVGFTILIVLQAVELSHYKASAAVAAPVAAAPAPAAEAPAPAAEEAPAAAPAPAQ